MFKPSSFLILFFVLEIFQVFTIHFLYYSHLLSLLFFHHRCLLGVKAYVEGKEIIPYVEGKEIIPSLFGRHYCVFEHRLCFEYG